MGGLVARLATRPLASRVTSIERNRTPGLSFPCIVTTTVGNPFGEAEGFVAKHFVGHAKTIVVSI